MSFQEYRLFADPSLLDGYGRMADFLGVLNDYNFSPTPEIADAKAMYADWYSVGLDMYRVIRKTDAVEEGIAYTFR